MPVGTIISYMGNNAPDGYLKCDGTEYKINDYKNLAEQIKKEFGSYNYFGGDGITTFAVSNLQGEFLRGTGTNSHEDQGSGIKVGTHQDATEIAQFFVYSDKVSWRFDDGNLDQNNSEVGVRQGDSNILIKGNNSSLFINKSSSGGTVMKNTHMTVRPTNTSVLYCIKY